MPYLNICLRAAAMLCGIALIASQVIQNLEQLGKAHAASGLGLAAIAVPIAMAVAVPVMQHCWTGRQYASASVAFVVLLCGLSHTMIVALERGAYVRDAGAAAKSNTPFDLAKKAHDDALARIRTLEAKVSAERRTGCKTACLGAIADLDDARRQESSKKAALAAIGAPVDQNSMGKRYGYIAHLIDLWHPLAMPLAVELGALVLIGFALHRGREAPTPTAESPTQQTKVEEAAAAIRALRANGATLGTVRDVSARIGHSHGTTQRAMKVA